MYLAGLDLHTWLKAHLKPNRYLHSKNVAEMAAAFSDIYDVNVELAVKAGIMHDAGKGFSGAELIAFCKEHKIKVPFFEDICRMEPSLLHSYVSAWIAQHEFVFFKYSLKTLTIKAVRTLYCIFIANELLGFYAYQLHIRRSEVVTIDQYHLKQFGAWLKVHFFAAIKNEFAVNFGKLGCKQ